jgi:hypothetical protein
MSLFAEHTVAEHPVAERLVSEHFVAERLVAEHQGWCITVFEMKSSG